MDKQTDKKYPDSIVHTNGEFDAKKKQYPTNLGAPSFEPLAIDKTDKVKANHYFESRLNELREEYKNLVEEYNWTKLVYEAKYYFQPIQGNHYYLYESKDKSLFLSLIRPDEWNQPYVGTFKLMNNGKWDKI
jgi:hypothetical protein